jgi:tRNA 5-methylaminomethyl-2-thiouridine biosynthesis bifunctional protein
VFAQAFARATGLYAAIPDAIAARGVLQLASGERDADRFAKITSSDLFEPGALRILDPPAASARLAEPVPAALDQATALVVRPGPILDAWTGPVVTARVAALERSGSAWRLLDAAGAEVLTADAVIVAAALASRDLIPDLPLQPVRGQASWTTDGADATAAAWGGYVLPTADGLLFGATHDRDDAATDLRPDDHRRNLATLAAALPRLAARIDPERLDGRASIRAVTPDRLPVAGPVGDGLFALTGFGSRGFSLAPLLAEHVAALALAAPSPIGRAAADLVRPDRFARRAARRSAS